MNNSEKHDGFVWVAKSASALACGVLAGFLYSLKQVNPSLQLEFSVGTLLMAALGALLSSALWKFAMELARSDAEVVPTPETLRRRRWVYGLIGLLAVGMMLAYFFAIKDVERSALLQVLQGTSLALVVIAGIGMIIVRLAKMLNRNTPPDGSTGEEQDPPE
jgi:drug/metabolite transporter (DMT)-like permease